MSTLGILDPPGAQRSAVLGMLDMLAVATTLSARRSGPMLHVSCWGDASPLTAPPAPLTALIVPPSLSEDPPSPPSAEMSDWLLARHAEGTLLCSVCAGAFMLGYLGLLDGRRATTHWGLGEAFAAEFPDVHLDTDQLIIDDGDVITAGGLMAWVDLTLRLIDRMLGPSIMLETARRFLVDPGGREQRFYRSFSPTLTHGDAAILKVQRWLQSQVSAQVTVAQMAAVSGLGERTLLRRFQKATGMKTRLYIQHLRVAHSRHLLEQSDMSQQEIAWAVGYEDPGAFRGVFQKLMGLSPSEYRRRFNPQRA